MLRRCFLRSLAAGTTAGVLAQPPGTPQPARFEPGEDANSPIGDGQGIHPGRVSWVRDPKATTWDGVSGRWWDDANTDQRAVNAMISHSLRSLTGRKNDKQAWDALFRHFNQTRRSGGSGYRPGERIAIKVNCNQDRGPEWGVRSSYPARTPDRLKGPAGGPGGPPPGPRPGGFRGPLNGLPSPHAIVALVTQLIEAAGVRGEDILIYDVTGMRNVGQPVYTRIRGNSNPQYQAVKFLAGTHYDLPGRMSPTPDMANPIRFAKPDLPAGYLPKEVTDAKYMINMALLRAHGLAGVTLIAKNHFGSLFFPDHGGWSPRVLHNDVSRNLPMGSYNALVDLMGHRHLGGKTMLYVLDGLYTAEHNEGNVFRWAAFGDQWGASILMSQDPVAIDSVGLDILRNEPRVVQVRGNVDNYLHEAAQASRPASGTAYDPHQGGGLASLGVHEYWNNAAERKYSRNLGRKQGIELVASL